MQNRIFDTSTRQQLVAIFLRDRRGSFYVHRTEAAEKPKKIFDRQSHFRDFFRAKRFLRAIRV
jgi:hypothetical protein